MSSPRPLREFFGADYVHRKVLVLKALHMLGCEVRVGPFGDVEEIVLPPLQPELRLEEPWST